MGTTRIGLDPAAAQFRTTGFAQFVKSAGDSDSRPVAGLAFDAAADEEAWFNFPAIAYGSGNLTVKLRWYADTASSGVVRWGAAIAAITQDTDTQDIETKNLATENTVDDTHLGTTGQRLHEASITVSNLDSLAALDDVGLRIRRVGSNGADTMAGDAIVTSIVVEYSDT